MAKVNIHEAKTRLSQLLAQVEAGEEVIIARAGTPVARIVAIRGDEPQRALGLYDGKIWMADDFNAPDPELDQLFYGDAE